MIGTTLIIVWSALSAGCLGETSKAWPRVDIFQPNFHQTQRYRDTRSVDDKPTIELTMHLPPNFKDVNAFQKFLGIRPERRRRGISVLGEDIVRKKRSEEAILPDTVVVDSTQVMVEDPRNDGPFRPELNPIQVRQYDDEILEVAGRGPSYEFSEPETDRQESNEVRKTRRNTSANDHEDGSMKRGSYPDPSGPTTTSPFWKQTKKSNAPTFVTQTQREGRGQNNYDLTAQHRNTAENSRESHMMKDKPMQSNEINPLRDSYYSASDPSTRRAYNSRQAETSSPKSAYDTLDFSASRRGGAGRSADARGRLTTDSYSYTRSFTPPRPYDSRYYYPLPGEVQSRGLEYYHRTMDPGTGRIVYYATLPEPTPNFDAYSGRTPPGRAYTYDAYGRPYPAVPTYPYYYPPYSAYGPSEYLRSGRNTAEAYQRYDDRYRDEPRNKTYVIYDAEEEKKTTGYSKPLPPLPDERTRYAPTLRYPAPYAYPPEYNTYMPYPAYNTYRNPYYPEVRGIIGGEISRRDAATPVSSRSLSSSFDNPPIKPLKP